MSPPLLLLLLVLAVSPGRPAVLYPANLQLQLPQLYSRLDDVLDSMVSGHRPPYGAAPAPAANRLYWPQRRRLLARQTGRAGRTDAAPVAHPSYRLSCQLVFLKAICLLNTQTFLNVLEPHGIALTSALWFVFVIVFIKDNDINK